MFTAFRILEFFGSWKCTCYLCGSKEQHVHNLSCWEFLIWYVELHCMLTKVHLVSFIKFNLVDLPWWLVASHLEPKMFNSCHLPYATLCYFESCRMVCSLEEGTRHPLFFDTTIPLLASKCSACHTLTPSLTSTVGTHKVHKILITIPYIPKVIIHSKIQYPLWKEEEKEEMSAVLS